jgi:membrane protein YdbS with pleckstrin-like domain
MSDFPAAATPSPQQIRPRKASFIFPRVFTGLFVAAILAVLVWFGFQQLLPESPYTLISILILVVFEALVVVSSFVSFRKERYELHPSHVRCSRGGLLSDQTTELDIRNITQVKIRLPWLRYKLFGIGHILIESAGNAHPAVLRFIRRPESVYAALRELMKDNGYALGQERLLHEERPALIGAILDCIGVLVAAPVFIIGIALQFYGPEESGDLERNLEKLRELASSPYALIAVLALAVFGVAFFVVRFLDLRRRTYRVYDDVVVYEEGFLTRDNAFIPYENIADAETKRTFIDKIFNLYDVHISCQGSSSAVKFRRLRHGPALSSAIDDLVVRARQTPRPAAVTESAPENAASATKTPLSWHPESPLVPPESAWTAEFRVHPARVLVPSMLLLPLVPVWIVAMIRSVILLAATSYAVRPSSIRHSFRFLNTQEREFTYDKITGLIIKRNPWDRLFNTMTIQFWSIGSGKALEFVHVKANQIDLAALKRQVGIPDPSLQPLTNPAAFGLKAFLAGRLRSLLAVTLLATALFVVTIVIDEPMLSTINYALLAALAIGILLGFLYSLLYHWRQRLSFHTTHVEAEQGIFVRRHYFACYRNIKKTVLTRYPCGDVGKLEIFVAGEQEAIRGKSDATAANRKPCSFTSDFLPAIREKLRLIDDILAARVAVEPDTTPAEPFEFIMESPRAVGNSVVKTLLLSLIPPLFVLLPITLPFAILASKRWRYRIESGRVVASWGILYHHQASVLLDRIDSIRHSQGPLNKMFRNGSVNLMTAGSSRPDLVIANSPDYQALYQAIRSRSSSAS